MHRNINILGNRFQLLGGSAISARSVDGLRVKGNFFEHHRPLQISDVIYTQDCKNVDIEDNTVALPSLK